MGAKVNAGVSEKVIIDRELAILVKRKEAEEGCRRSEYVAPWVARFS